MAKKPKHGFDDLLKLTKKNFPSRFTSANIVLPRVKKIFYTPFVGVKLLSIRSELKGQAENKSYKVIIVFEDIDYSDTKDAKHPLKHTIKLSTGKEKVVYSEMITRKHPVRVRCSCKDAYFRFLYYCWESGNLYGPKPRAYTRKTTTRPSVNPAKAPGFCKHMLATYFKSRRSKYFA